MSYIIWRVRRASFSGTTNKCRAPSVMPLAGLWQERRSKPQLVSTSCHKPQIRLTSKNSYSDMEFGTRIKALLLLYVGQRRRCAT